MTFLELRNVSYSYPGQRLPALSNASLAVPERCKMAVVGRNGSGKSTLFLHCNGILRPQEGAVHLGGRLVAYDRASLRALRSQVGIVFQNPDDQLFSASVAQDISFGPLNLGLSEQEARRRVEQAAELCGISDLLERPTHALSWGQKTRAALAGVLAMDPAVLIADEVTSSLDPWMQRQLLAIFERLASQGKTLLIATHDMDLARRWANLVAVLDAGRVLAVDTPERVFSDSALRRTLGLDYNEAPASRQHFASRQPTPTCRGGDAPGDARDVGVILLGHGSRGEGANDGIYEVLEDVRSFGKYPIVEVSFMQRNFPTVEEAARICVAQGAKKVYVLPYFLHFGLHIQKDLPAKLGLLRAMYPGTPFVLGKPFAHHARLTDIVLDRIADCAGEAQELEIDEGAPVPTPRDPARPLRTGYTTGACAAAAAKAAAQVLLRQKRVMHVEIALPAGQRVTFPVGRCQFGPDHARCSVVKDAGDDPDVTDGAEICARVSWNESPGIVLEGGEGVGVVTKPGLGLAIGGPAINPVPRQMILTSVAEALVSAGCERGVQVVISVLGGEALALKTLNGRLGIIGGISILGTTGIVVPFSTEAYTACISQALSVASAAGCKEVVLTTGRRSERFAQRMLDLPEEVFIQMGDFAGFALEECVRFGMEQVVICAMIGKLSKLAANHLQTHADSASVEQSFLAEVAADCGADPSQVRAILEANTARQSADILSASGWGKAFERLCQLAAENCRAHVEGGLAVDCILVDFQGNTLGRAGVGSAYRRSGGGRPV
ncbi:MAG: cobalt-precorrin-5B (C(1))-methyltransferase [Chloroflexi bacterium]|nr:cobalt-precorrin-5B (C(1))-methyltransferase [Chloroflexota bacterium]